jgi:solute carrier family 36 (proton-coupled amino acid transporter)
MTDTPTSQDQEDASIVSQHLPSGYTAEPGDLSSSQIDGPSASAPDLTRPEEEDSLKLLGGDIHRDLYKIKARAKAPRRAATFSHPNGGDRTGVANINHDFTQAEQMAPGGFRRQFLMRQQGRFQSVTTPVTDNFVSFLALYGSFAGEDLAESDDEAIEDGEDEEAPESDEQRPLLGRRKSSRVGKKGDAGKTKTFFTLLKAFVGTGIMFLPKAFNNGGILFSSITLLTVSIISALCFHLLLQCRKRYGGGYGELGEAIGGPKMRSLILSSITISQIGFVCSGIIFCAENLYSFMEAVTGPGPTPLSANALIALQLVVLIPLAFIRNISKLGLGALLADVFILIGLTYIYWYDISSLASNGIHPTVQLFNPNHFTLTVGSAIFTFEGIGLILPIQSSMREPEKFSRLLYIVMVIITLIFTSVGFLCYATFGDNTRVEIISNYPQDSKLVNAVQFLYSIAVLVGTPVQLFPAIRILEGKIFGHRSGKQSVRTKWKKNGFRTLVVVICAAISIVGASDLDKFVALIGSFACVPLVYIYPAVLHYRGVAESPWVKAGDGLLMLAGLGAMIYTTGIAIMQWSST